MSDSIARAHGGEEGPTYDDPGDGNQKEEAPLRVVPIHQLTTTAKDYSQQTDQEFEGWVLHEMTALAPQVRELYPTVFLQVAEAVRKWRQRYHGNSSLWNRLFKPQRVLKEVVESVPVIQVVQEWMEKQNDTTAGAHPITILDLCSGKGYLSMLLSEILPKDRVEKCILLDKAWPLCHSQPKPHHMSWDHIYTDNYFNTWPIPLHTSKQDLKQSRTIQQLAKRLEEKTVLILAVHLCGILSLQAIHLFQALSDAPLLLLKPCCLPDLSHTKRQDNFQVGNYSFPTAEVCAAGKFVGSQNNRVWKGPPRWHLEGKFHKWCHHLQFCMPAATAHSLEVPVQTKGGYQNIYLIARRATG